INASVSQTTRFAPFELNGGYLPSMLREFREKDQPPPGIKKFASQTLAILAEAHDTIIKSHVFQTHHTNKKRSSEPPIQEGDLVYLSTCN
ncbi:hypothetical protein ARMSODRAFT_857659, partial [Armillaria solidipes]